MNLRGGGRWSLLPLVVKFTDVRVLIILLANHQDAYFTETECQNVPLRWYLRWYIKVGRWSLGFKSLLG